MNREEQVVPRFLKIERKKKLIPGIVMKTQKTEQTARKQHLKTLVLVLMQTVSPR